MRGKVTSATLIIRRVTRTARILTDIFLTLTDLYGIVTGGLRNKKNGNDLYVHRKKKMLVL